MDAVILEESKQTHSSETENCVTFAQVLDTVNVTTTGSHAVDIDEKQEEASENVKSPQKEELKKKNYKKDCSLLEGETSEAVVLIDRALCANYNSDSDSESNESDSVGSSSTSETSSGNNSSKSNNGERRKEKSVIVCRGKNELSIYNLPPIEELKITVPEKSCIEVGVITSIVDILVIVESYKGSAALDVDTVLFLDCGRRALGKVFEILGPVSEPVYAIRFNSEIEIRNSEITKGLKVYYAPQTQHTTFVLLADVLKCRGSDASWKDNVEAPSEYQDFSDDEEETKFKSKINGLNSEDRPLPCKRVFSSQTRNKIIRPAKLNMTAEGERNMILSSRFLPRYPSEARQSLPRCQDGNCSATWLPPPLSRIPPYGLSYCPSLGGTATGTGTVHGYTGAHPSFIPPVQMNIGFRSPGYLFPVFGTLPTPGLGGAANAGAHAAASWSVLNQNPPPPPPPPPPQDSKFSKESN